MSSSLSTEFFDLVKAIGESKTKQVCISATAWQLHQPAFSNFT